MLKLLYFIFIGGGCWHKWSKWEPLGSYNVKRTDNDALLRRCHVEQRHCMKCNKLEVNETTIGL
jgi:hypothetical protein